ncbi:MAG: CDP-alcohol phosphatidyltransferase family protein [Deltaproteobacteria bacterium]|nr:CDP-alcohol phosphatidyltransferase family protein [Deltaproteobacteria bacterium]
MSEVAPKVAIAASCEHPDSAPLPARVCGVDTRTRLTKTLEKKGYRVVDDASSADEIIEPCRIYAGNQQLSLCRDGLREVETQLLLSLRKNVDGMVARHLNRKISGWVSGLVMNTRLRPNHVTVFTIVLGVLAGPAVAMGSWAWGVVGASLLQLQSILDGVDGELSRLKFQGSKLGEWLDTISDDVSNLSFFAGATYVATEPWVQAVGLAGMGTFVVMQSILYYLLATVFRSGNLQVFQWEVGSKDGLFARIEWMFKRDFFCLLFLALAIADQLAVAVLIFSVGTVISFITLLLQLARGGVKAPG